MVKDTVDCDIRVRYAETDQMGVAYYANYLVWFEVGRSEFCRKKDFSYAELEKLGYRLVVTEAHCHYRNAARYDETITVRTRLKHLNKRIITFAIREHKKTILNSNSRGFPLHFEISMPFMWRFSICIGFL